MPVPMSTVEETEWKDDTEVPLSSGLQDVSRLKLWKWDWEMTALEVCLLNIFFRVPKKIACFPELLG